MEQFRNVYEEYKQYINGLAILLGGFAVYKIFFDKNKKRRKW